MLQVYTKTIMNSMEIEKDIASDNNNKSSFKNKRSPLKLCPSDKQICWYQIIQKLRVMQKQMQMQSTF